MQGGGRGSDPSPTIPTIPTPTTSTEDQETGVTVAVKKITKPLSSLTMAKRTYRELMLLKHIQHENVISLLDVFYSPAADLYLFTELFASDLHQILQHQPLQALYQKFFLYQILRGLKYLHSADIVHR